MNRIFFVSLSTVVFSVILSPVNKLRAQCNPQPFEENSEVLIFNNATKIVIADTSKDPIEGLISINFTRQNSSSGKWQISQNDIDMVTSTVSKRVNKEVSRKKIKFGWFKDNTLLGRYQAFKLKGETDAQVCGEEINEITEPSPPASGSDPHDVGVKYNEWLEEIKTDSRLSGKKDFVAVLFDENLKVIHVSRDYTAVGDWIFVGVLRDKAESTGNITVGYSPCAAEPEAPQVYVGDTFTVPGKQAAKVEYIIEKFPPKRCFNTLVTITVKKKGLDPNTRAHITTEAEYVLQQYKRYRATLQMGVLFSNLQEQTFALKKDGNKTTIYSKGPENTGPQYVTSLVIYSFPRYLSGIFSSKHRFLGRDIIHDHTFTDRIGAVLGVGLNDPGCLFYLGFSFELLYGINLIGVYEFVRINELVGLKEGDEFSGTEAEIPTRAIWDKKIVFGLSIDLRYVTALFSQH
ncbi:MAG: hypothetical protein WCC06_01965 [Candidatus Aminicenantales bacterium]